MIACRRKSSRRHLWLNLAHVDRLYSGPRIDLLGRVLSRKRRLRSPSFNEDCAMLPWVRLLTRQQSVMSRKKSSAYKTIDLGKQQSR